MIWLYLVGMTLLILFITFEYCADVLVENIITKSLVLILI